MGGEGRCHRGSSAGLRRAAGQQAGCEGEGLGVGMTTGHAPCIECGASVPPCVGPVTWAGRDVLINPS
jgi:hypothetical protein